MFRIAPTLFSRAHPSPQNDLVKHVEHALISAICSSARPVPFKKAADQVALRLTTEDIKRLRKCSSASISPAGEENERAAALKVLDKLVKDCVLRHPSIEVLKSGNLCCPNIARFLALTLIPSCLKPTDHLPSPIKSLGGDRKDYTFEQDQSTSCPPTFQAAVVQIVQRCKLLAHLELADEEEHIADSQERSLAWIYRVYMDLLKDGHFFECFLEMWHPSSRLSFYRMHEVSKLCLRPLLHGFVPVPMTIREVRELLHWDSGSKANVLRKEFGNVLHCLSVCCNSGYNARLSSDEEVQRKLTQLISAEALVEGDTTDAANTQIVLDDESADLDQACRMQYRHSFSTNKKIDRNNLEASCRFFSGNERLVRASDGSLTFQPYELEVPLLLSSSPPSSSSSSMSMMKKFVEAENEIYVFSSSLLTFQKLVLPILTPLYRHFTEQLQLQGLPVADACNALLWSHHLGSNLAGKFLVEYLGMFPEYVSLVPATEKTGNRKCGTDGELQEGPPFDIVIHKVQP